MVSCYVPMCKNRSDFQNWKKRLNSANRNRKVTFHSFPKNDTIRTLWVNILGINKPHIPATARICSDHFKEESLDRTNPSFIRIKPNSLPFIEEREKREEGSIVACSQPPVQPPVEIKEENKRLFTWSHPPKVDKATMTSICTKDNNETLTLKIMYNAAELCRLKQEMEFMTEKYTRKIRDLQQNLHWHTNQLTKLREAVNILKQEHKLH